MCNCGKNQVNTSNCSNLTPDIIQSWLTNMQCILTNVSYNIVNLTLEQVNYNINILQNMLADKQAKLNSCNYQQYVNQFTTINNNIILANLCP